MKLAILMLAALLTATTFAETAAEKAKRMKWFDEARFGLFIHFGLYAVPAGEWNGKTNHAEWIRETAHIPVKEYEKFQSQFNPVNFDAEKIVLMAKNAGMKYVVITTKHHDGFALFDSKFTDWDVMGSPFKRDIMAEMAAACRKHGMKMCWYHSIMDWHHPDYLPRRSWEDRPIDGADMDRYMTYLEAQVTELLTKYGDIGLMWFDGEWESTWNHERGQKLYNLCRKLQPNVIVNNRVDVGRGGMGGMSDMDRAGDYGTPEQEIPDTGFGPGQYWESCMTLNNNWGFNKADHNWKPTKSIIQMLADIASKGGNYLLNVGPMASGDVPPESIQRLKEVGDWMKVNSSAIQGTVASPFSKPSWGRVTVREGANSKIYLHVFDWPASRTISLSGLGSKVIGAKILGGSKVSFTQGEGTLEIKRPTKAISDIDTVVEVSVTGPIVVYSAPQIIAASQLFVGSTTYTLSVAPKGSEIRTRAKGGQWAIAKSGVPVKVTTNVTIEAQLFVNGKPVSEMVHLRFKKVEPQAAMQIDSNRLESGLVWGQFKGKWEKVPDFGPMTPFQKGITDSVSIAATGTVEYVGQQIIGFLLAPSDGVYEFALGSDDGSNLWIDSKKVVDNDGLHSFSVKTGQIALAKGFHPIFVDWFNASGGAELALTWGKPGTKLVPLTGYRVKN